MIYFCIPTYNEERTVGVVLWKLRQVMGELQRDYQIIVVDDASTDSTPAVLSPYIRVLPLTVIRNSARRGYADSLELAIREAVRRSPYPKRDAVVTLQADFTEDPDVVETMMKRFEAGADVVATNAAVEESAPRSMRWGRRFLKWLLRKKEWAAAGDPLSGLRAYRVVVLKRAVEARGNARLLSWPGLGANVELLALTVPLSRRNDAVDTTLLHHRLQRESRFSFMTAMREVRGAATGKIFAHAHALPTDSRVATPLPIAVEPRREQRDGERRGHGQRRQRPERGQRGERTGRPQRGEHAERGERKERGERPHREKRARTPEQREKRREKPQPPAAVEDPAAPIAAAAASEEAVAKKKRKRRRRGKKRPSEQPVTSTQLELAVEQTEAPPAASDEAAGPLAEGAAPHKKKSRRGRRGGRGRRRGPRPNATPGAEGSENNIVADQGGEAPPPIAAEGD